MQREGMEAKLRLLNSTAVSSRLPLIVGVAVGGVAGLGIMAGVVIALSVLIVAVLRMRKKLHIKSIEAERKGIVKGVGHSCIVSSSRTRRDSPSKLHVDK